MILGARIEVRFTQANAFRCELRFDDPQPVVEGFGLFLVGANDSLGQDPTSVLPETLRGAGIFGKPQTRRWAESSRRKTFGAGHK